jgi:hypothetical protein
MNRSCNLPSILHGKEASAARALTFHDIGCGGVAGCWVLGEKRQPCQLNRKTGWFVHLSLDICLPIPLLAGGLGIAHVSIYSPIYL